MDLTPLLERLHNVIEATGHIKTDRPTTAILMGVLEELDWIEEQLERVNLELV